ncbi:MAG: DUF4834 domain-containing protein [Flavobacteriaceae bacterium]|jgi:hypothetical protein|nr:DUF4834 domain-containing protein [Flavobacteriaceae bacterium]
MFLKIVIFVFAGIYLLRALAPWLFKLLFTKMVKQQQAQQQQTAAAPKSQENNSSQKRNSDDLGEYIDYEEID